MLSILGTCCWILLFAFSLIFPWLLPCVIGCPHHVCSWRKKYENQCKWPASHFMCNAFIRAISISSLPVMWVKLLIFILQVDAHNVVPCWEASPKLEYAARTIRGKITKLLPEFLTDFPLVEKHPYTATRTAKVSAAGTHSYSNNHEFNR